MPSYDYACATCGGFEAIRRLAERDEPCACPGCGAAAPRVLAFADARNAASPTSTRNEANYQRFKHRSGCACC